MNHIHNVSLTVQGPDDGVILANVSIRELGAVTARAGRLAGGCAAGLVVMGTMVDEKQGRAMLGREEDRAGLDVCDRLGLLEVQVYPTHDVGDGRGLCSAWRCASSRSAGTVGFPKVPTDRDSRARRAGCIGRLEMRSQSILAAERGVG